VDGDTLAELSFEESLKEDAVAEIRRLRGRGLATCIVSGDRADRVAATALRLGIPAADCAAGMSPEGKAAWIRDRDHRDTLMVGDGINDAPAFAAAFAAATPAVDHPALPARADFYFLGDGIRAVRVSLEAARRLRAVIRGTLVTASAYNIAALILCYLGLIGPLAAAVLMPVSSVAVVSITAYRLGRRNRP
jgi:Cu2+-exporting ATPase